MKIFSLPCLSTLIFAAFGGFAFADSGPDVSNMDDEARQHWVFAEHGDAAIVTYTTDQLSATLALDRRWLRWMLLLAVPGDTSIARVIGANVVLKDDNQRHPLPICSKAECLAKKDDALFLRTPLTNPSDVSTVTGLLKRGVYLSLEYQTPEDRMNKTFHRATVDLKGSAAALAKMKDSYERIGQEQQAALDAQTAAEEKQRQQELKQRQEKNDRLIADFHFPEADCGTPILRAATSEAEWNRHQQRFYEFHDCLIVEMYDKDEAVIKDLVLALGGTWRVDGDTIHWSVPKECECRDRVKDLFSRRDARDDQHQKRVDDVLKQMKENQQAYNDEVAAKQDSAHQAQMWENIRRQAEQNPYQQYQPSYPGYIPPASPGVRMQQGTN